MKSERVKDTRKRRMSRGQMRGTGKEGTTDVNGWMESRSSNGELGKGTRKAWDSHELLNCMLYLRDQTHRVIFFFSCQSQSILTKRLGTCWAGQPIDHRANTFSEVSWPVGGNRRAKRKPTQPWGEHANSVQYIKAPDLNPEPSCC